jgi:hypothetical protein
MGRLIILPNVECQWRAAPLLVAVKFGHELSSVRAAQCLTVTACATCAFDSYKP